MVGDCVRWGALVVALVVLVGLASSGGAATPAVENATGADASDARATPEIVATSIHELDSGDRVLVVVVETTEGIDALVADLDAEASQNGESGGDVAPNDVSLDDDVRVAPSGRVDGEESLRIDGVEGLPVEGVESGQLGDYDGLQAGNVEGLTASDADGLQTGGDGAPAAEGAALPSEQTDAGDIVPRSLIDVPETLRAPPAWLTDAVSWEPAFGAGWLLPGALAVLGTSMAVLGGGALAVLGTSMAVLGGGALAVRLRTI
jgi:hypothetical protein